MPTLLKQLAHHASGSAVFQVRGPAAAQILMPEAVEIAIVQPGPVERYLDPRNPDDPWTTTVHRFRPVSGQRKDNAVWLEIDYGVSYHLRANQPYKLQIRQLEGMESEEIFTGPAAMRMPSVRPDVPAAGSLPGPVTPPVQAPPPLPPPPAPPPAEVPAPIAEPAVVGEPAHEPVSDTGPSEKPGPTPAPRSGRRWLLLLPLVLLLAGVAAYLYRPAQEQRQEPAVAAADVKADAKPEAEVTLASVRETLAGNPDAAAARAMADKLAASGKLLDAQFLLYRHAAEKGDSQAARIVGGFYDPDTWSKETSPLPAANPTEAARWLKQAAEAGDAEGQYRYAMLLKQGRTEEADGPEQAVAWLRKAAEQGHEAAKKAIATP